MKDSKHIIVKKYLEGHSLLESNVISFNEFIAFNKVKIEKGDIIVPFIEERRKSEL